MDEYSLSNHPDDDHEHREALMPCKRCGATPGGAKHNCFGLKPMSLAPRGVALTAIHYERGLCEIRPDQEGNYWFEHITRERNWFVDFDDEGPSRPDIEFDGWLFELAE